VVEHPAVDAQSDAERPARTSRKHGLVAGVIATSALVIGIGVGPAGALDLIPGPWHSGDGSAATAAQPDRSGRASAEDASCGIAPAPVTTSTSVAAPSGGASLTQQITVVVPPIVRVQSDNDGELRVITNAARPPAPGDLVYLRQSDGNFYPADQDLVDRVLTARWADASWCSTTAEHHSVG